MPQTKKPGHNEEPISATLLPVAVHNTSGLLKQEAAAQQSVALRQAVGANQVMKVSTALNRVDVRQIDKMNQEREALTAEIERLRDKYADTADLFKNPERQAKELERIRALGESLKTKMEAIPRFNTIKEDMALSEVETIKELATLVQWVDTAINTNKGLSNEQIAMTADAIAVTYGHLLLEDIATAFRAAVMRPKDATWRLDAQVIMLWVKHYDDARCARIAEYHEAQHQKTKG